MNGVTWSSSESSATGTLHHYDPGRFFDEVDLTLSETILPSEQIDESNAVLVNEMPVEKILDAEVIFTECSCCFTLMGEPACCRAIATDRDM